MGERRLLIVEGVYYVGCSILLLLHYYCFYYTLVTRDKNVIEGVQPLKPVVLDDRAG